MKIDQLTYFLETARNEHIGKASKALRISASAISHSIAALEAELGRELFVRRGKHISLTNDGKRLQRMAAGLLREIEAIKNSLVREDLELEGHFRVAASHVLASRCLTPAVAKFQNQFPRVSFEIFSLRSADVISGVLSGEFELGICFSPQRHSELEITQAREGQLLPAVAKTHPLLDIRDPSRQIEALNGFAAVMPKGFPGIEPCERHPVFKIYGVTPKIDCSFDNYEVAVEKISRSLSWGFLPDWVIGQYADRITALACPVNWNAAYQIGLVETRDRVSNKTLEPLRTEIVDLLRFV